MTTAIGRPESTEHVAYFGKYISLVSGNDVIARLSSQLETTPAFLKTISAASANFRYAHDKWSIKEVVGHVIDTERIMAYRALRFSRNDLIPIEGFEQDDYIRNGSFGDRTLEDLVNELQSVRESSIYLFRGLDSASWLRQGQASNNNVSVRALAYIIAGHELHHLEVLRTRYAQAIPTR